MNTSFFEIKDRKTAVIATAIHDGHKIDTHLLPFMKLSEADRAREEDPYTASMISELPVSQIIVSRSRFQLDLNRTKDKAIYERPEDAWGLHVWENMPENEKEKLCEDYDDFYAAAKGLFDATLKKQDHFFVLDVHTYNHRRENANTSMSPKENPEINLGTAYNHERWTSLCNAYAQYISTLDCNGQKYDARENVKFKGGAFAQWIIKNYGEKVCVLSVEFKKTFMDEWTGIADIPHITCIKNLLQHSVDFLNSKAEKF